MKAQTPVIAVIILIGIASSVGFTIYNFLKGQVSAIGSLQVDTWFCYNGVPTIKLINNYQQSIDVNKILVAEIDRFTGQLIKVDFDSNREKVPPGGQFSITIKKPCYTVCAYRIIYMGKSLKVGVSCVEEGPKVCRKYTGTWSQIKDNDPFVNINDADVTIRIWGLVTKYCKK